MEAHHLDLEPAAYYANTTRDQLHVQAHVEA